MNDFILLLNSMPDWFYIIWLAIVGSAFGSFLNVLIYRIPRGLSIVKPSSHCPECKTAIRPWNNIPVLSYIFLGGKCAKCKTRISPRYVVVELLAAAFAVWSYLRFGLSWEMVGGLLLGWHLIALAFIDLETMTVPDHLVLPMALGGFLVSFANGSWSGLLESLLSAGLGGGFILVMLLLSKFLFRKEGVGVGDITMAAAFSTYLMPVLVPLSLAFAAASGLIGAGIWSATSGGSLRNRMIPFVPALATGAWLTYLYGGNVLGAYMNWAVPLLMSM